MKCSGFSLIEALVVMAMASIILVPSLKLLDQSVTGFYNFEVRTRAKNEMRALLLQLGRQWRARCRSIDFKRAPAEPYNSSVDECGSLEITQCTSDGEVSQVRRYVTRCQTETGGPKIAGTRCQSEIWVEDSHSAPVRVVPSTRVTGFCFKPFSPTDPDNFIAVVTALLERAGGALPITERLMLPKSDRGAYRFVEDRTHAPLSP